MPEAPHGAVAAPGSASNTVGLGFDGTAPPVQPFTGWARLLVVLAWVALLASILFMFTYPDWSDAQVRASDGMVLRDAQWSLDTENASEQWVTLPHRTPPFDTPTTSRYRLAFNLDQPLPSEQRLGLCVARWALSADVWLDGQRLATALQGFNALLEWNRPHYLALPPALAAGSHVLEFRVQPAPRGIDSMLSALWLGDDRMLRPGCEALTARHREQPATLRGALFAIGLLALMIGWRLRDPVSLWLAALAGVWTLQHLMLHMAAFLPIGELNLRMSPQSFLVGQMLLRFGFMLPLTVFCLRYLGLRLPRIERFIWAVAGAAALLLLVLPLSFHWGWWVGVGVFSTLLMLGVLLPLARHAWRHGSLSGDILLLSMLFLLASNLVDLLRPWIWMPEIPAGLSQVAVPTIIGTFGLLLAERLWLLYRRQQDAADSLGAEVARQREQLQQNFALLRQQRDAEVEADERLRITRELHDGLGSHLVAAASLRASASSCSKTSRCCANSGTPKSRPTSDCASPANCTTAWVRTWLRPHRCSPARIRRQASAQRWRHWSTSRCRSCATRSTRSPLKRPTSPNCSVPCATGSSRCWRRAVSNWPGTSRRCRAPAISVWPSAWTCCASCRRCLPTSSSMPDAAGSGCRRNPRLRAAA